MWKNLKQFEKVFKDIATVKENTINKITTMISV